MKKNSIFTLKNILYSASVLLAVVAFCMLAVNAFSVTQSATILGQTVENTTVYTGVQAVFGKENALAFSFMNLLSYIFVFAGVVLALLRVFGVLKSKIFDYVIVALFVVAAVFFFLTIQFVVWDADLKSVLDLAKSTYALGAGPIVAGILSILSAGCVAVASTRKK